MPPPPTGPSRVMPSHWLPGQVMCSLGLFPACKGRSEAELPAAGMTVAEPHTQRQVHTALSCGWREARVPLAWVGSPCPPAHRGPASTSLKHPPPLQRPGRCPRAEPAARKGQLSHQPLCGPGLPIMSRMLWWLEMMTQGWSTSSFWRPLVSKRRPNTYLNFMTNHLMILRGDNVSEQVPTALHPVLGSGLEPGKGCQEHPQQTEPWLALLRLLARPWVHFPCKSLQILSLKGSARAARSPVTVAGTGKTKDRKERRLRGLDTWQRGGRPLLHLLCGELPCGQALTHTPACSARGSCKGTGG